MSIRAFTTTLVSLAIAYSGWSHVVISIWETGTSIRQPQLANLQFCKTCIMQIYLKPPLFLNSSVATDEFRSGTPSAAPFSYEITVTTPRDRDASFYPQFIKKSETMLSEGTADRIIGLYALGTSTRDISSQLEETVGTSVSAETISSITDRVLPELEAQRIVTPAKNGRCLSRTGALSHNNLR